MKWSQTILLVLLSSVVLAGEVRIGSTVGSGGGTVSYPQLAPDGSSSAPSYSFTSSPETGMYYLVSNHGLYLRSSLSNPKSMFWLSEDATDGTLSVLAYKSNGLFGGLTYSTSDDTIYLKANSGNRVQVSATASVFTNFIQAATTTFSALGSEANGTMIYCSDCTSGGTCAGSGSGAFAVRSGGAWVCPF